MKLIIFDFDGTLVDSRSLILESHQIVFSEFQLPAPSPVDSLALVGKSLDVILTQLAGPTAPIRVGSYPYGTGDLPESFRTVRPGCGGSLQRQSPGGFMTYWHDTMVDTPETDGAVYVTGWTISPSRPIYSD